MDKIDKSTSFWLLLIHNLARNCQHDNYEVVY